MKLNNLLRLLMLVIIVAYSLTMGVAINEKNDLNPQNPYVAELNPDQQQLNLSGLRNAYHITVKLANIITNLTTGKD